MTVCLSMCGRAAGPIGLLFKSILLIQADRGCALVAFFWGGKGACGIRCYATWATDLREERNPSQADTILIERKLCTVRTILQYYHKILQ